MTGFHMKALLNRFAKSESGSTAIEYSLIAVLISIAVIAGATAIGGLLDDSFNDIADDF
jgi:pilus assembly protein Flp/PilA